jgi:probable phosphoglycerate mutase
MTFNMTCGTTFGRRHSTKRVELKPFRICSMKRTLHLVRHGMHAEVGRALSGRSEIPLDARGRVQAEKLALHLASLPITSVHSSPCLRARETALPIANQKGLEIEVVHALDEVEFGRFSGRSFVDLADDPDWVMWNAERDMARCPDGENMAEAVTRALNHLKGIELEQTPAVCVSHCDIIRGVVCNVLGLGLDRIFSFDCDPGSVTTLVLEGSAARLVSLNERCLGQ